MKCGDPNNPSGPHIRKNGKPCNNDVVAGTGRCHLHGGSTPNAKMAAERMLAAMRLPAIESLSNVVAQLESDICPTCLFPRGGVEEKRLIVSTCTKILDRTGFGPRSVVEVVKQSDGDLNLALLTVEEKADMLAALARIREIKAVLRARQAGQMTMTVPPAAESPAVTVN